MNQSLTLFLEQMLPFWDELSTVDQEMVIMHIQYLRFDKGQELTCILKETQGMLFIHSGQLKIFLSSAKSDITLFRLRKNEVLGINISEPYLEENSTLRMLAESIGSLYLIPASICISLSKKNEKWYHFASEKMSQRLYQMIHLIAAYSFLDIKKRIAYILLDYYKYDQNTTISITHESLANDLGTAREVISRTLKELEHSGLLHLGRCKISILDIHSLKSL